MYKSLRKQMLLFPLLLMSFADDPESLSWYEQLYAENYERLVRFSASRLRTAGVGTDAAADIAQEVFLIGMGHEEIRGYGEKAVGWLIRTADNLCKSYARKCSKEAKNTAYSIDDDDAPELADANTMNWLDTDDLAAALKQVDDIDSFIEQIKGTLSIRERLLFIQVFEEQKDRQTLMKMYGISSGALAMRILRMKMFVRKYIVNLINNA